MMAPGRGITFSPDKLIPKSLKDAHMPLETMRCARPLIDAIRIMLVGKVVNPCTVLPEDGFSGLSPILQG